MKQAPDILHGKKFEKYINEVMHPLHLKFRSNWRRILDSASAGNLIEATEGDFELLFPSGSRGHMIGFVVECKASKVHLSLGACFRSIVKVKQLAKMRLKIRAGMYGVYLFHSVENEEIEVWAAPPIIEAHPLKRTKFFCQPALVSSYANFPHVALEWFKDPEAFLAKLIRSETVPVGV